MNDKATEQIHLEYTQFCEGFKTVIISSVNQDGSPHASYAPFVRDAEGHFYIFISGLAKHTENILTDKRISLLLIQNEEDTTQPFARKRLTFKCTSKVIERKGPLWNNIMSTFNQRFGDFINTLISLPDFTLIKIQLISGTYVKGFGEAYSINGIALDRIERLRSSTG
jgi:putative heme iron utilization protein